MTERDNLIYKLKIIIESNEIKQNQYQEDNNLSSDVGCLTREVCQMASLLPEMRRLSVTFDDCY